MFQLLQDLLLTIAYTVRDVLPIVVVIFGFQLFILRKPIPHLARIVKGFVLVLLGLGFFLEGLEAALFPLGRLMAQQLTDPAFITGGAADGVPGWSPSPSVSPPPWPNRRCSRWRSRPTRFRPAASGPGACA